MCQAFIFFTKIIFHEKHNLMMISSKKEVYRQKLELFRQIICFIVNNKPHSTKQPPPLINVHSPRTLPVRAKKNGSPLKKELPVHMI
ncbi:hypothetical protein ABE41_019360 [Fictibacillus arsenicus]|uniref:Uncharacterized protein n=1 Tax=Fictibacillus arsenicus TaxID=255247 RepID=A0A1B1Z9S8_9BACL|nr:hypothetical protein ABE41_019360 [Fictibacillus arsenicus]